MSKKETVLIKVSYLVELSEEKIINDDNILDRIMLEVGKNETILATDKNYELKWNGTSSIVLSPSEMNCGKCANCGGWVTDREKDNPILDLCNGAMIDGKLFCDECLPIEHRWAF